MTKLEILLATTTALGTIGGIIATSFLKIWQQKKIDRKSYFEQRILAYNILVENFNGLSDVYISAWAEMSKPFSTLEAIDKAILIASGEVKEQLLLLRTLVDEVDSKTLDAVLEQYNIVLDIINNELQILKSGKKTRQKQVK